MAWQRASSLQTFLQMSEMHNQSIFCTLRFVIGLILCEWLQGKLRYDLRSCSFITYDTWWFYYEKYSSARQRIHS